MSSGQLMTMPVLIVNMGGEMVYIIEQRLRAQKVPDPKGSKVLNDVVRTMYYPRFIEELFKPQVMYSIQSTRQIFDRLAHSSIMRLHESSMDKLFDLMTMGFKYQIISCSSPLELIDTTQNHLDALRRLVENTPPNVELLEECVRLMQAAYSRMPVGELNAMRQSLCAFFQDRKVKVSLFLQDRLQNSDGSLVVASGGPVPAGSNPPGTVRYFSNGAEAARVALPVATTAYCKPASGMRTQLGSNVYDKDRAASPAGADAAPAEPPAATPPEPVPAAPAAAFISDKAKTAAAVGELNTLAALIGAQNAPPTETFKLESLFGADVFHKDGRISDVINIDGAAPSQYSRGLNSIRQDIEGIGGIGGAEPDDLLDLMDKA